jgi:hypothetical protein
MANGEAPAPGSTSTSRASTTLSSDEVAHSSGHPFDRSSSPPRAVRSPPRLNSENSRENCGGLYLSPYETSLGSGASRVDAGRWPCIPVTAARDRATAASERFPQPGDASRGHRLPFQRPPEIGLNGSGLAPGVHHRSTRTGHLTPGALESRSSAVRSSQSSTSASATYVAS